MFIYTNIAYCFVNIIGTFISRCFSIVSIYSLNFVFEPSMFIYTNTACCFEDYIGCPRNVFLMLFPDYHCFKCDDERATEFELLDFDITRFC